MALSLCVSVEEWEQLELLKYANKQHNNRKTARGTVRIIGVIIDEIKEREVLLSADITYRRGRIKEDKGGKSAGELPKDDNRKSKRSVSSEEDIISGKLKGNADAIKESIQKAIEKAIEAKVSLIQGS